MKKSWDILGIGIAAVDDLLYVDHYPQPDEKIALKMKTRQGGGLTATALVAAARQGAKTAFCGYLDDDELSNFIFDEFVRDGVDTSLIQKLPGSKPFHSTIIVDQSSGSRTIIYSNEGTFEPDQSGITEKVIGNCLVLFIDHFAQNIGIFAADIAHSHGIPVIADIENLNLPNMDIFLSKIDHLIISEDFASKLTKIEDIEEMVKALSNPQRAACVITAGDRGCWYSEYGRDIIHYPAFSVNAIDTTGCGDVFHGAYAAALARNEPISQAIQVASATAAIKATSLGGREGIPDLVTVERFLESNI